MGLDEAFAPVEAVNTQIVLHNTWGHLAPEPHRKYYGWFIVAKGAYGDYIIFDYEFKDLPDSPWFFEHFTEYAFDRVGVDAGVGLYKYEGWYKLFKNGNCQFGKGTFTKLEIAS